MRRVLRTAEFEAGTLSWWRQEVKRRGASQGNAERVELVEIGGHRQEPAGGFGRSGQWNALAIEDEAP